MKPRPTRVAINKLSHLWHVGTEEQLAEMAGEYVVALWAEVESLDRLRRSCRAKAQEARLARLQRERQKENELKAAQRRVAHLEQERDELADMVDRWAMGLATSRQKKRARPSSEKG